MFPMRWQWAARSYQGRGLATLRTNGPHFCEGQLIVHTQHTVFLRMV